MSGAALKIKLPGVRNLEDILKVIDSWMLGKITRRQHAVIRAIAELIFEVYLRELREERRTL